jgi:hypothetical protein
MASQKQKEVQIKFSDSIFPRTMLFNRFGVERVGAMQIFYFALLDDDDDRVRDSYACAVDDAAIQRQKKDLLDYVARAGEAPVADLVPWKPKTGLRVEVANVIKAARSGSVCELRLYNFAMGDVIDAQRFEKIEVNAQPVALLRCEESLQRALFLSLYEPEIPVK